MLKEKTTKSFSVKKRKDAIFYASMAALPLLQFFVFYVVVNFNSISLAFQKIDVETGKYSFAFFDNFKIFFETMKSSSIILTALKNSLLLFIFSALGGTVFALLFSYYIYKKRFGSSFFRVILFLPSIISGIIMVLMFKMFTERVVPSMVQELTGSTAFIGFLSNESTAFGTIIFYNIWVSFGTNILIYVGAMSRISDSVSESAQLDGAGFFREFISITLPIIYPTITTFLVASTAGILSNQAGIFSFFGERAEYSTYTFGYYLFRSVAGKSATIFDYPYLSAVGVLSTLVAAPLTLGLKKLLEKIGPVVEA